MLLSDTCLSVAYIGPKSRTKRPRKIKIGTEVANVTSDSDTTFKVKRSRSPDRFAHRPDGATSGCSGGRENVLAVGNCCYVAVCWAAQSNVFIVISVRIYMGVVHLFKFVACFVNCALLPYLC